MPTPNQALLRYDSEAIGNSLSPLTRRALRDFAADGITLTLAEIIWLNERALRVSDAARRTLDIGCPVRCGERWLWPMTIQSARWLCWIADKVAANELLSIWAVLWAHDHARTQDAFVRMYDLGYAVDVLMEYGKAFPGTTEEIKTAICELRRGTIPQHQDDKDKPGPAAFVFDKIAASLCEKYGATPEYWKKEETFATCLDLLRAAKTQGQANGKEDIDANSPIGMAQMVYDHAVMALRLHHEKQRDANHG